MPALKNDDFYLLLLTFIYLVTTTMEHFEEVKIVQFNMMRGIQ